MSSYCLSNHCTHVCLTLQAMYIVYIVLLGTKHKYMWGLLMLIYNIFSMTVQVTEPEKVGAVPSYG